jgi:hypothetical protein
VLPFQIGEFFDQPLYLLLVLDGFPYALFPLPRYEQLAQLSPLPPNQVETGVEFSPSTTTTGFTAAHVAQRKGAAEKAGGVDDLCQAGAAPTFAIRELRAVHRASNLVKSKNRNANLLPRIQKGLILRGSGV